MCASLAAIDHTCVVLDDFYKKIRGVIPTKSLEESQNPFMVSGGIRKPHGCNEWIWSNVFGPITPWVNNHFLLFLTSEEAIRLATINMPK